MLLYGDGIMSDIEREEHEEKEKRYNEQIMSSGYIDDGPTISKNPRLIYNENGTYYIKGGSD